MVLKISLQYFSFLFFISSGHCRCKHVESDLKITLNFCAYLIDLSVGDRANKNTAHDNIVFKNNCNDELGIAQIFAAMEWYLYYSNDYQSCR